MSSSRRTPERVLAGVAAGVLVSFLIADYTAHWATSAAKLRGVRTNVEARASAFDDKPVLAKLSVLAPLRDGVTLDVVPMKLDIDAATFFSDDEIASWNAERDHRLKIRGDLSPPVKVRALRRGNDVEIRFDPNPVNAGLRDLGAQSLLTAGYQIYRWRDRDEPALLASLPFTETTYRDRGIGPRSGTLHYSVKTVLNDRIGDVETLIESSAPMSVQLDLDELFELDLVSAEADRAVILIVVPIDADQKSHQFEVDKGAQVGSILPLDGSDVDFRTGLTLKSITIVETTTERPRRIPVFNADGSRAVGESGFLFRDEIRTVPIRRTTVALADERGAERELTRDDDVKR